MSRWQPFTVQRRHQLLAQRGCLAALLFGWFDWLLPTLIHAPPPYPVGVAQYVDFSFLADPDLRGALRVGIVLALIPYTFGVAMPFAIGALALLWTGAGALACSHGDLSHSTQLVALVLIAQFLAYAKTGLVRRINGDTSACDDGHELAVWYTQQVIVASYVVAGVTKLVRSSGQWMLLGPNLAVQIARTHDQAYYSSLPDGLMEHGTSLATFLLAHPKLTNLMLGTALLLELGAVVALVDRRIRIATGLALLAMHLGIRHLMMIDFVRHERLILVYLVEIPVLGTSLLGWLWTRWTHLHPSRPSDSPR